MRLFVVGCAGVAFLCGARVAQALVRVDIDLSSQTMHVDADAGSFDWPISSARSGFYTPNGSFAPTHLELMHYSRKYHMSPMPHAIFFRGGYAIHGTYSTGALGSPASHGCVRLSPGHAAELYDMVLHEGARISIRGTPPASHRFEIAEGHHAYRSLARVAPPPQAYSGYAYRWRPYSGYAEPLPEFGPRDVDPTSPPFGD